MGRSLSHALPASSHDEGNVSVVSGGVPRQNEAQWDDVNARIIGSMSGKTVEALVRDVRELQGYLTSAVHGIPDPCYAVFIRLNRAGSLINERFQMMAGYWQGHVEELKRSI